MTAQPLPQWEMLGDGADPATSEEKWRYTLDVEAAYRATHQTVIDLMLALEDVDLETRNKVFSLVTDLRCELITIVHEMETVMRRMHVTPETDTTADAEASLAAVAGRAFAGQAEWGKKMRASILNPATAIETRRREEELTKKLYDALDARDGYQP